MQKQTLTLNLKAALVAVVMVIIATLAIDSIDHALHPETHDCKYHIHEK